MLFRRCFRGFVLPPLEYRCAVWCSAADKHLKLLDRVVSGVTLHIVDLWQYYCMLYKIRCNSMNPLYGALPVQYVPVRVTRGADRTSVHLCAFSLQNLAV